jgi:hypothetical protein
MYVCVYVCVCACACACVRACNPRHESASTVHVRIDAVFCNVQGARNFQEEQQNVNRTIGLSQGGRAQMGLPL